MPPIARPAVVPLLCLTLAACGGGGSDPVAPADDAPPPGEGDTPELVTDTDPGVGEIGVPAVPDASIEPPADAPEVIPGATLRIDTTRLCPTVGEAFELAVELLPPPDDAGAGDVPPTDVSASVSLTQSLGEGLELLSQGDGAISLRMTRRDIVALRADLDDAVAGEALEGSASASDLATGRTVYVAGFAPDAPASVLMRKPVAGGCLYALRLPDRGFCGTALTRGGGRASLGSGDIVLAVSGCTVEGAEDLPLIDLPPTDGVDGSRHGVPAR